ncbi:tRNA(Ile)-lysidine synthase [Desulfatibacillum alkenivorans DSM 16219]|jgi:tRNA(Ile)-lysidine synthase|uniref:tRNA(Ile)-lysidine synthase n=1 Tax=Desulfatibacillum alkenivorans DSM 16219 TaxID=1121393 RepID=A0A1M6Y1A3_9BACT|nr:tRNA lysidine(34) synthetase TilS [Desulfatibacillum alkenivorans]SHL11977.1 tRNA(Ile)-lysidine synthase [Desulfatibacillum alkenivorans DSM 16219]
MTAGHVPPIVDPFMEKVRQCVKEHAMLFRGARVLAGVSGGPDSTALVHVLSRLQKEFALQLGVAHVNHCLRGEESDRDALFVQEMANSLDLPFHPETVDVAAAQKESGLSLEEAAREARKAFFSRVMQEHGYDLAALGHHADDNAEWMLISLIRGTGAGGLSGIPPVNGKTVRPLFKLTRKEILEYCRENDLKWVQDSTNQDQSILRNQIRLHLLPILESQYNPAIVQGLNRLSDILRLEHQWMDGMARDFLDEHAKPIKNGLELSLVHLVTQPLAMQRRIVLQAMAQVRGNTRKTSWTHVHDVLNLTSRGKSGSQAHLPDGLEARRVQRKLEFILHGSPDWARTPSQPGEEWRVVLDGPGTYRIPQAGLTLVCCEEKKTENPFISEDPMEVCMDLERASFPLTFRPWKPGDRFTPLGAGGTQKVKKFLIDHKVPAQDRQNIYVLTNRETVLWLVGRRLAEPAKILSKTRRILRCKVFLA